MGLTAATLDRTFAALADPHRRRAMDLLRTKPASAGDLARALDLPAPTMSRHLKVLRDSGLVVESHPEFDARVRVYALKAEGMTELRRWLDDTDRMWSEQLAAFKARVEAPAKS
jgi:DNA-binding transcriptional ArsR family regulator